MPCRGPTRGRKGTSERSNRRRWHRSESSALNLRDRCRSVVSVRAGFFYFAADFCSLRRHKRVKPALMVFLLISFPLAISWAQKQSSADADSVAIKQVVAPWSDAFNRHDSRAVAMLFPEHGDFTNPRGLHRHGRKEIEDRFASTLSVYRSLVPRPGIQVLL